MEWREVVTLVISRPSLANDESEQRRNGNVDEEGSI